MIREDLRRFANLRQLYTNRLKLRALFRGDVQDVYEYASDPRVSEYLLWSPHESVAQSRVYLMLLEKKYKRCEFYDWGIEYNGKIIGTCGFTSFSIENNSAEIGYVLSSKYWGQGIAAEALKRVMEFGFSELGLNRIEGKYMAANERSLSVMKKCHMTLEGIHRQAMLVKGAYRDIGVAAITRDEYCALIRLGTF